MVDAFARVVVAARLLVVAGWIVTAAVMTATLPTLREAQTSALGQLVPADSRALEAEELSADLFAFPLASRTVVVERDPSGLSADRVIATGRLIADVNRRQAAGVRASGAYGVTNAVADLPFARERGTTALSALNAVNTHDTPKTLVSNRRTISGRASVTTDESARTSPTEPAHTSSRTPALRAPLRERSAPDLIRGMTSWKHPLFRLVSRMTMPRNSSRAPALGLATQR